MSRVNSLSSESPTTLRQSLVASHDRRQLLVRGAYFLEAAGQALQGSSGLVVLPPSSSHLPLPVVSNTLPSPIDNVVDDVDPSPCLRSGALTPAHPRSVSRRSGDFAIMSPTPPRARICGLARWHAARMPRFDPDRARRNDVSARASCPARIPTGGLPAFTRCARETSGPANRRGPKASAERERGTRRCRVPGAVLSSIRLVTAGHPPTIWERNIMDSPCHPTSSH